MWASAGWLLFVWVAVVLTNRFSPHRTSGDVKAARATRSIGSSVMSAAAAWVRAIGLYSGLASHVPQLVRYCAIVHDRADGRDPAFDWTVKTFARTVFGWAAAF